jgi:hypothetical protein
MSAITPMATKFCCAAKWREVPKRKHWIGKLYFRLAGWAVFTVRNGLDHPI